MALLSLANAKAQYLRVSSSDTSQDTRLTQWLAAWEDVFLERIGVIENDAGTRTLSEATYTVIVGGDFDARVKYGDGGWVIPPVIDWTTTTLHSSTDGAFNSDDLHASSEYADRQTTRARDAKVKLLPGYSFASGAEIQLVGTGGYSTVPSRYIHPFGLALDWFNRAHERRGLRTVTIDNRPTQSFTVEDLPPDIVAMIDALAMPWKVT